MSFANTFCAIFACLGCVLLFDNSADISVSKILLVALVSTAFANLLADASGSSVLLDGIQILFTTVQTIPLPEFIKTPLINTLLWVNTTMSTSSFESNM